MATGPPSSPAWSHVVRPEAEEAPLENGAAEAWKNGSGAVVAGGSVMGAESWPALSEAIRVPRKSNSSESLKGLANGSASSSSGLANGSASSSSGLANGSASSSSGFANGSASSSSGFANGSASSSSGLANGSASSSSGLANGSASSSSASVNTSPNPVMANEKAVNHHGGGILPDGPFIRPVDLDNGLRPAVSENLRPSGSNRRVNNAGNGGQYHSNFGNNRSYGGGRDVYSTQQQQQRPLVRPFLRPQPPAPAPFIAPPHPIRPFTNHIGYHDMHSPVFYVPPPPLDSWRGVPFAPPAPVYFAPPDMQLRAMVLQQIDYYFSPDNLSRDTFLRQNMDDEGWVSVSLVAGFRRVAGLTNNIPLILDIVRGSAVVEVQGDKLRRRNDWRNWPPLPRSGSPRQLSTSVEAVADRLSHIRLDEARSREEIWSAGFQRSSSGPLDAATRGSE